MFDGKDRIGGGIHGARQTAPGEESPREQREERDVMHGGSVGRIMETVLGAPPRAIILVSGLTPDQYNESAALLYDVLAERQDVTLISPNELPGKVESFAAIEEVTKAETFRHPNEKIVVNIPSMIRNMFFGGVDHSKAAEDLTRPLEEDEDTAAKLIEWLQNADEDFKGEWTPEERFRRIFDEISRLAAFVQTDENPRSVMLALPVNTMLSLALLTYARERELTPEAIKRTQEKYPNTAEAIAVLRIIDGEPILV